MKDLTRTKETWRQRTRHWWYDFEWPVVGGLALVAVLLGCIGFHLHLARPFDPVDLLFKSCQLFFLQVNVEPPMPWQLNVARVLAPLVAGYTALQALAELFSKQMQSFRLRFLRGHVVICGLGRKGLVLARGFLERGQAVVVIERDEENDYVRMCRDLGAVVMIGDATEPWLLNRARITRAKHLFAICGDDGVNAEVAVRAARLVDGRPGAPLTCRVHIFDPELCLLLRERELDSGSSGRLRLEFFNVYDLGARVLLEENPLCPANRAGVFDHVIIVGVGRLGESLIVNAARQWKGLEGGTGARLRVTLVDQYAKSIADNVMVRHPILQSVCDLVPLEMDVHSAAFHESEFLEEGDIGAKVFVCLDDDSLALSAALALMVRRRRTPPAIVVRMAQDAGLAVLLKGMGQADDAQASLRAFGLLDRTCHPDQVMRGTNEIMARAIHDDYLRQQTAAGVTPAQNASMVPWDALPADLQETNREQAADIGVKLRAVRCGVAPVLHGDEPEFAFAPNEVELMARMEHDRWMHAKVRDGWKHGPMKDANARTHPCLLPFDALPPEEQEKDRSTVRLIPPLLARLGFRVHRLPPRPERT